MNFAFPAVLLFLFILPGLSFRRSYYSGDFSYGAMSTNLLNELYFSLYPAIIFQYVGISVATNLVHLPPRFDFWGYLFLATNSTDRIGESFLSLQKHLDALFWYNLAINGLSAAAGISLKKIILRFNLDLKYDSLTFNNRWYYLFTGRIAEIKAKGVGLSRSDVQDIEVVMVDVLCSIGKVNYIYRCLL